VYALEPAPFAALDAWLARYRPFWQNRLDALGTGLARGRRADSAADEAGTN
jgi:hypothetical protein